MPAWVVGVIFGSLAFLALAIFMVARVSRLRKAKKYERGLKMTPLLIHLPPSTDDIEAGGRDKRDITNEAVSKA